MASIGNDLHLQVTLYLGLAFLFEALTELRGE
jgi:hypothetical protein